MNKRLTCPSEPYIQGTVKINGSFRQAFSFERICRHDDGHIVQGSHQREIFQSKMRKALVTICQASAYTYKLHIKLVVIDVDTNLFIGPHDQERDHGIAINILAA